MAVDRRPGGLLFVMSGPSGAGKTAVLQQLREREPRVHYCITATTRSPRPGERHGVDYYFYDEADFLAILAAGGFLEHARIPPAGGKLYGTPAAPVREALHQGRDVFLSVDVQGAHRVRELIPQAVLVFLAPPDLATLRSRLMGRGSEPAADLEARMRNAHTELAQIETFDYVVVNHEGQLMRAVDDVLAIIRAERCRTHPRFAA